MAQNNYSQWAAQNPYNQPMQYQVPQQFEQQQTQNRINSSRVWVQGEGAGKAFIVANNTEQVLWDSEHPSIYIKTVDATGRPNMTILDYTIRKPEPDPSSKLEMEVAELKQMMKELMDQNKNRNYNNYNKKKGGDE